MLKLAVASAVLVHEAGRATDSQSKQHGDVCSTARVGCADLLPRCIC